MKITRENLKNIVREAMVEESAYQEFFKKALEKTGKSIPEMSEEEKKAFFNKIDKSWNGKGEKKEIVETELEEAQSPAQKAAFAKMLAKKDGKDESTDDEKEEVKESNINEDKVSNGTVSTLEKGIQRILGTEVNHDINRNGAHEFYIDDAEFVIGVNDGKEKKVAYSFSIYDDGARKYLGKGTAADEKDLIKQVLSIAKKYKKQLLLTTESVNEAPYKQPDKKLVKVVKGTVGAVQNDIELIEEMIDESAILEAMDHCKDAIDRLQYLHKILKRIK